MANFYTNFQRDGAYILLREVVGTEHRQRKIRYAPKLYVPTDESTEFKTLDGVPLKEVEFSDMFSAHQYSKDNPDAHGNTKFEYAFVNEEFPDAQLAHDPKMIRTIFFDIEVCSQEGFPDLQTADQEVTAICCYFNGIYTIFGRKPYTTSRTDVVYQHIADEKVLLEKFIDYWHKVSPDVVSGWYVENFDIPYIIRRCRRVGLGEKVNKLSPWGKIKEHEIKTFKGVEINYELVGMSVLDLLALYKRFQTKPRESYKLDYIAKVEVGREKVPYDGSLFQLYNTDHQKFIDYNQTDVELCVDINKKLQLVELVFTLAYWCKVNYVDIFGQIKLWDTMVTNYLLRTRNVLPKARTVWSSKLEQNAGGYVKSPTPGARDWVVTFDVASLYPSLVMSLNISPDTILRMVPGVNTNGILTRVPYNVNDGALAANGAVFKTDQTGFVPELIDMLFAERKKAKKEMLHYKALLEKVNDELKRRGR